MPADRNQITEPDWDADDFDSWGDPEGWPIDWWIKAKVRLIRHFSKVDLVVDAQQLFNEPAEYAVTVRNSFTRTDLTAEQASEFLQGFLDGCESMAAQWDCRERKEDADE